MANWWKYGLCVFGGLGIGFAAGVRITKNRSEEEYEQRVADIREIYRNDRRASTQRKKPEEEKPESARPDITTKTSIQMEKLSQKRDRAERAANSYGAAFKETPKPGTEPEPEEEKPETKEEEPEEPANQYIRVVNDFPEDSTYRVETLKYYADDVLCYAVTDKQVPEEDIPEMIGDRKVLKRLGNDGERRELKIVNDLWGINYTIIFQYQTWGSVVEEEPYKAEQ